MAAATEAKTEADFRWRILVEPQGQRPDRFPEAEKDDDEQPNEGGMIVYLVGDVGRQEVSRIGFVRRNSKNPDVPFADQLDIEMGKAKKALEVLREQLTGNGVLQ